MSNIVLGIDPGQADTGWGVIDGERCLDYGVIRTSPDLEPSERLRVLFNEMLSIIDRFEPRALGVEGLYFFKNKKTAMRVAEARGVILLAGARKKLPIYSFTPLQVKMAMTGYGRASKKQVQEMVKEILKLDEVPKPDDAADALGVALCCVYSDRSKILQG